MSVFAELFKSPHDTQAARDDHAMLVNLCGRTIGRTRDGKQEYVVYDGNVYMRGQPRGFVNYFDFCNALRKAAAEPNGPPDGIVADFFPADGFHLGWPKPQGECSEPRPHEAMTADAAPAVQHAYELMDAEGGHGGPVHGLHTATHRAAERCLGRHSNAVNIVPRDHRLLDPRNAVRRVFVVDGVAMYQDHPAMNAMPVSSLPI
jgi:hypothetical protein